ncbi:MAG: prepilin-type N-terminal cleavage/methylation domain-containing protein [Candidatus Omnitrophica bacterium]|nr:prepilin-type N-terminal cleavage/methylation domain-containing protein [Candidatus Omnitrophota bacterium]
MLLDRRGFTLVETLIALAILAMIVVSTFAIFTSSSRSWQKGEERSERYHTARVAMGRMAAEISQSVISEDASCKFIGKPSEIEFVSFVSTDEGVFELAEIGYWLDRDQKILMRSEDVEPDYDFTTQGSSNILADNISELTFSYYDGTAWNDEWDSNAATQEDDEGGRGILPKAVKIRINIENKKGRGSEIFELVAHLKTA